MVLNHPTGNALANFQSDIAKISLVRNLRGPQNNLIRFSFNEVNQTRIAVGYLHSQTNNFAEHLIQRKLGTHNITNPMKKANQGRWWFHMTQCRHI